MDSISGKVKVRAKGAWSTLNSPRCIYNALGPGNDRIVREALDKAGEYMSVLINLCATTHNYHACAK